MLATQLEHGQSIKDVTYLHFSLMSQVVTGRRRTSLFVAGLHFLSQVIAVVRNSPRSEVVRGCRRLSQVTAAYCRSSQVVAGCLWLSLVVPSHRRLSQVIVGRHRSLWAIASHRRLSQIVADRDRSSQIVSCCHMLSQVVAGIQRSSQPFMATIYAVKIS